MSRLPALVVVSATELITRDGIWEQHPRAWEALMDWCRIHGLDPHAMPVNNRIVRDVERCRIEFDQIVTDADGNLVLDGKDAVVVRRVHAQGETPPMPWPFEMREWQP